MQTRHWSASVATPVAKSDRMEAEVDKLSVVPSAEM
jgi:hypothetical protein